MIKSALIVPQTWFNSAVYDRHCFFVSLDETSTVAAEAESLKPTGTSPSTEKVQTVKSRDSQGDVAAVQPVMGISQRVRTGPQKKKDLGTLGMLLSLIIPNLQGNLVLISSALNLSCFLSVSGYVIGILMMGIIIILGAGITVGYFYKRSVSKSQPKENIGTT